MGEHPILWKVRTRWAAVGAAVAVVVGAGGIAVSGATNAQVTPSQTYITPCRIMDTRPGSQVGPRGTALASGTTHTIQVTGANGNCTIPADASGVLVNLTVVSPGQSGFVTVFPGGAARPTASSINYSVGVPALSNQVPVGIGATGQVSFYAFGGPVNLVADITGYTTGARMTESQVAQNRWDKDLGKPATVTVGLRPVDVVFDGTSIWITKNNPAAVSKINPTTNTVTATITLGGAPPGVSGMAFDGTSIWVTNFADDTVKKISPATNTVTATVPVGDGPVDVAFDGTSIWVANNSSDTVSKINPVTNTVTATVNAGDSPGGVAFDGTSIWVTNTFASTVKKINPATNTVTATVNVVGNPVGVAFDGTSIWTANLSANIVSKINPATNTVTAAVSVGNGPGAVAFDGTSIWVANSSSDTVSKINPATNTVTATIPVGAGPAAVAFDGTSIWVANSSSDSLSKLRTG